MNISLLSPFGPVPIRFLAVSSSCLATSHCSNSTQYIYCLIDKIVAGCSLTITTTTTVSDSVHLQQLISLPPPLLPPSPLLSLSALLSCPTTCLQITTSLSRPHWISMAVAQLTYPWREGSMDRLLVYIIVYRCTHTCMYINPGIFSCSSVSCGSPQLHHYSQSVLPDSCRMFPYLMWPQLKLLCFSTCLLFLKELLLTCPCLLGLQLPVDTVVHWCST